MHSVNDQTDRYDLVLSLLAQLVLASSQTLGAVVRYRVPEAVLDEIKQLLEEEEDEWMDLEMITDLLGTRDVVRLM